MTDIPRLLCARVNNEPLLLADNETGKCSECGHLVQFRPHAPNPRVLICIQCAPSMIEVGDELSTTRRMVEDAKAYFRKKMQ